MRFRLRTLLVVFFLLCSSEPLCKLAYDRYREAQRRESCIKHPMWTSMGFHYWYDEEGRLWRQGGYVDENLNETPELVKP